ncbi:MULTISPECIES: universal stress protein [unclassified Streptomyces]|uniref:universal stress protein n=1 Tax=unclassified Streptomyces TaxID=2593676 RepID=UPI002E16B9D0|nr:MULTISPECIES: universal stress protein [unclassified Streptomyces]
MTGSDATPALSATRVVVGVNGTPGSRAALRRAADEAGQRRAELWAVLAWQPPGGELHARRAPAAPLPGFDWENLARTTLVTAVREVFPGGPGVPLRAVLARGTPGGELHARRAPAAPLPGFDWENLARTTLVTAVREVFPGGPGVPLRAVLARGTPGMALAMTADREDDLLVVGAGHRGRIHRALRPSVSRYCVAHAACPVLTVPPPPLEADLATAHRRNVWRLRLDTRHFARETTPPAT